MAVLRALAAETDILASAGAGCAEADVGLIKIIADELGAVALRLVLASAAATVACQDMTCATA